MNVDCQIRLRKRFISWQSSDRPGRSTWSRNPNRRRIPRQWRHRKAHSDHPEDNHNLRFETVSGWKTNPILKSGNIWMIY